MNLTVVDWILVAVAVIALRFISIMSSRHMKGVADFLSANRCAGRYLLAVAGQMGGTGVISLVALFEMYYEVGLPPIWWGFMGIPISIAILLSGWVYWRFRETRALTLAQFFEMRYSRNFRIFAGFLCWTSGVINFGIFPAVAARFFIYFCGLPNHYHLPGLSFGLSTFATVMAVDLGLALVFVTQGGQISVIVTEFFQGIFCGFAFLIIAGFLLLKFPWPTIVQALSTAPVDASMLNPYCSSKARDFNIWFFLIGMVGSVYNYMAWQSHSGFQSSAKSPHEQRMGGVIGGWRSLPLSCMVILLALAAFAVMTLPEFSTYRAAAGHVLSTIDDPAIRTQMTVPVTVAHLLPVGIKGLLMTAMLFFSFTCHDTYMHSWGSIFIQDVYMPLRKTPMTPQQHIRYLRYSIVGVAIFSFLFSLLYPQGSKILMFFAITGTIWLGGAGAVIIGGLYWKWGTTAAAYTAVIVGAFFGCAGLIVPPIIKSLYKQEFPVNNQWLYLFSICLALLSYLIVSLLTRDPRKPFDLNKMLHRDKPLETPRATTPPIRGNTLLKITGINQDFTFTDKLWAISLLMWNAGWFITFLIVTAIHALWGTSTEWWGAFWRFYIGISFVIGIPVVIWFSIGGLRNIQEMFRTLGSMTRNHADDGQVIHDTGDPDVRLTSRPFPVENAARRADRSGSLTRLPRVDP